MLMLSSPPLHVGQADPSGPAKSWNTQIQLERHCGAVSESPPTTVAPFASPPVLALLAPQPSMWQIGLAEFQHVPALIPPPQQLLPLVWPSDSLLVTSPPRPPLLALLPVQVQFKFKLAEFLFVMVLLALDRDALPLQQVSPSQQSKPADSWSPLHPLCRCRRSRLLTRGEAKRQVTSSCWCLHLLSSASTSSRTGRNSPHLF
jgi:hypothetical protein